MTGLWMVCDLANPNGTPENLTHVKPGQVLNPEGRNQYTYRRIFEDAIEKLLVEEHENSGKSYAQVLAETALSRANKGDGKLLAEVMKRTWPELQKHEVAVTADFSRLMADAEKEDGGGGGWNEQDVLLSAGFYLDARTGDQILIRGHLSLERALYRPAVMTNFSLLTAASEKDLVERAMAAVKEAARLQSIPISDARPSFKGVPFDWDDPQPKST